MSWLSDLFLGRPPQVQTGRMETWTPEHWQVFRDLMSSFGDLGPGAAYPGQLPGTEGPTPYEQTSLAGLENWANMVATGGSQEYQDAMRSALSGQPADIGGYFKETVQDPMLRTFREEVLPDISRAYGSNYWGSERLGAQRKAAESLTSSLTSARANMAYNAEEAARNRMLSALGLEQSNMMLPGQAYESFLTAGALPRLLRTQGQQAQYQEWLRQQGVPYQRAGLLLQLLGLSPYENYAVGLPGQAGMFQGFMGGAGQGLGQAAGAATFDWFGG